MLLGPALAMLVASPAVAGPKRAKRAAPRVDHAAALAAAVERGDVVAQCRAAIAAAKAGDIVRASLVLPACDAAIATAPELAADARAAQVTVARTAEREDWSPVELVLRPAGASATLSIDRFPGLPVPEGRVLLPTGAYVIRARNAYGATESLLSVADGVRALVLVQAPVAPAAATHGVLDFTEGEPTAPVAGPPPKIDHGSLLPERFRRALALKPAKP